MLDGQFGSGTPTTWHFGLATTIPNDDGTNFVEPTGIGAYGRVAMTNNATNFPGSTTTSGRSIKSNGTKITWPNPTATWGEAKYLGAFTGSTGGTPEYTWELDTPIMIRNGNTPVELDIGAFVVDCD